MSTAVRPRPHAGASLDQTTDILVVFGISGAVDIWLSIEDLPRPKNRVTLPHNGSLQLAYQPTNQVPKARLLTAVNPALTAMANALRVGDHLLERLGATSHEVAGVG